jgi:hypothetical protein
MKPSQLTEEELKDVIDHGTLGMALEYEDTGPGKFEAAGNPGLAERLYDVSLQGWSDDETGSVEWMEHVCWLGRFLLYEDDRGFVTYEEFSVSTAALVEFNKIEAEYHEWLDATDVPF